MTKYSLGKKSTIDEIKKRNIIEVHLLKFFPEIKKICREFNIPIKIHNDNTFFKKFSIEVDCVGVLKQSYFITENFYEFEKNIDNSRDKSIILILDSIQDTGNMGSIIRTAKSFFVEDVIFKKNNQAQINDVVIKNSMGSINSFNFLRVSNLSDTIEKLKKKGYWIYCSCLKDSVAIEQVKVHSKKIAIIVGNESNGVSSLLQSKSDYKVSISINSEIDSLNVSVATGILLFFFKNN